MGIKSLVVNSWRLFNKLCEALQPYGDLFIRIWVARVFFKAGLSKITTWSTTVMLFTHEYKVPLVSPEVAAFSGTLVELVLPVFLVLGLGGRIPAFILFIFNIVAVISYPYLLTEEGVVGLNDHIYWGILLMVLLLHGTGKLSIDAIIAWWWRRKKA